MNKEREIINLHIERRQRARAKVRRMSRATIAAALVAATLFGLWIVKAWEQEQAYNETHEHSYGCQIEK